MPLFLLCLAHTQQKIVFFHRHYTTKKFAYITPCFPDIIETVFTGSCFIAVLVDEFLLIFADAVL